MVTPVGKRDLDRKRKDTSAKTVVSSQSKEASEKPDINSKLKEIFHEGKGQGGRRSASIKGKRTKAIDTHKINKAAKKSPHRTLYQPKAPEWASNPHPHTSFIDVSFQATSTPSMKTESARVDLIQKMIKRGLVVNKVPKNTAKEGERSPEGVELDANVHNESLDTTKEADKGKINEVNLSKMAKSNNAGAVNDQSGPAQRKTRRRGKKAVNINEKSETKKSMNKSVKDKKNEIISTYKAGQNGASLEATQLPVKNKGEKANMGADFPRHEIGNKQTVAKKRPKKAVKAVSEKQPQEAQRMSEVVEDMDCVNVADMCDYSGPGIFESPISQRGKSVPKVKTRRVKNRTESPKYDPLDLLGPPRYRFIRRKI